MGEEGEACAKGQGKFWSSGKASEGREVWRTLEPCREAARRAPVGVACCLWRAEGPGSCAGISEGQCAWR